MNASNDIILLLTATIKPSVNISQTKLKDSFIREIQYKEALNFYLNKTNFRIVFVENSNSDISASFDEFIEQERLEMLFFDEDEVFACLGKGYGEMRLIDYALKNSKFINTDTIITKITGRLILLNIKNLLTETINRKKNNNFIASEFMFNMKSSNSRVFIASYNFYKHYLLAQKDNLNDNLGYYFEHALANSIYKSLKNNYQFIHFPVFSKFSGFSGTLNEKYNENSTYIIFRNIWCKIKSLKFKLYEKF